jgi:hypothetical protein
MLTETKSKTFCLLLENLFKLLNTFLYIYNDSEKINKFCVNPLKTRKRKSAVAHCATQRLNAENYVFAYLVGVIEGELV